MKHILVATFIFTVLVSACNNKSNHGKIESSIEASSELQVNSKSAQDNLKNSNDASNANGYAYKSDNGDTIEVTFFDEKGKQFVKVKMRDKADLVLEKTNASADESSYEYENYKWTNKNKTATLTNGTKSMELVLIGPLQYEYTNSKELVRVIYFERANKRFVALKREHKAELILEQTHTGAKGTAYGKGNIQWQTQGNEGTWVENGNKTKFIRKAK